ncbi:PAS domain S-box protein [Falsochrobactrum sp. TDYN1]|uniref:Blue-light-activated histidine kinase n=2 Tax=Falsochrobactrum tianjinense TaxID=2706015 RepID=A0A949PQM3_9HYPH|nr:HWE histidine kinase domain-containing protein [Falsochrobactrum sp. TDYN1]MBV2143105.1 PAS domain S-box protein [Falsochrobactrum sp. TDYN1]
MLEPSKPFPGDAISKQADPFRAAVEHTPTPMLITNPRLPDNPIVFVNRAFLQLTGYEASEIVGRNCRFLQGRETASEHVDTIRAALAAERPIHIDILNYKKSGESFWNRLDISPIKSDDGVLQHFISTQIDVTLEIQHRAELQKERDTTERHKDQLNYIANIAKIGFWTRDQRSGTVSCSAECRRILGLPDNGPIHFDQIIDLIALEDRMAVLQQTQQAFATGGAYSMEYRIVNSTGKTVWVETRAKALLGDDPTLMGVIQDITERKKAEADKALVTREISHRFKNSMAMVQSIANQTLRNASDPMQANKLFNERLHALAQAHDMLLQDDWGGATIRQIADTALAPFNSTFGHRIRMDGPPLFVSDRITVSLSLGLYELATNAVKYGALSNEHGVIDFNWNIVDDHGEKKFQMRWVESNGPRISRPSHRGFGQRLLRMVLAEELKAYCDIEFAQSGLKIIVLAPISFDVFPNFDYNIEPGS